MGNLTIRNFSEDAHQRLVEVAESQFRTIENQARFILHQYLYKSVSDTMQRVDEVTTRLNIVLELLNRQIPRNVLISELAKQIGEQYVSPVERWFEGLEEPSFEQLQRIAIWAGLRINWLLHGAGKPYYHHSKRLPEDPVKAVEWLLSVPDDEIFSGDTIKKILLVREKSNHGALMIIKQFQSGKYALFPTPLAISSDTGAGGRAMLVHFFRTLRELYKFYVTNDVMVLSYLVSQRTFDQLAASATNPETLLTNCKSLWWEDVWDKDITSEYWSGCKELCSKIQIEIDDYEKKVENRDI